MAERAPPPRGGSHHSDQRVPILNSPKTIQSDVRSTSASSSPPLFFRNRLFGHRAKPQSGAWYRRRVRGSHAGRPRANQEVRQSRVIADWRSPRSGAVRILDPEILLRGRVPLVRRPAEPARRLRRVLRDTRSGVVAQPQVELRLHEALVGRQADPSNRLTQILRETPARQPLPAAPSPDATSAAASRPSRSFPQTRAGGPSHSPQSSDW